MDVSDTMEALDRFLRTVRTIFTETSRKNRFWKVTCAKISYFLLSFFRGERDLTYERVVKIRLLQIG